MKFTLSWLKEHLETDASLEEITDALTAIGLELEDLDNPRERLAPFKVAYVKAAIQHPDADRLRVCIVDAGDGDVQVVCGAPNARSGMKGVFAPVGAYIPGTDMELKEGEIRGQASRGMLCSERELELSDEHDGIIDLDADAPVGMSYAEYIGKDDPVIEINLTPNRGDCAGVRGIARDLAAAGLGTLKPNRPKAVPGQGESDTKVILETEPDLTPAFAYRMIRNVENGPSPTWLQQKLIAVGQKPISALVDITNWMTLDQCRPMHVFDADKISGDLVVRMAKPGETMLALTDKEYEFDDQMVVIADDDSVCSLAGIVGGEDSSVTAETTNVLLEAALWHPSNIARTGRKLDVPTDARFRFERGTDEEALIDGMEIATQYALDFVGGEPSEIELAGEIPERNQVERFDPTSIASRGGLDVETTESLEILDDLGFEVTNGPDADGVYSLLVPSWRNDVQGSADLVEEVTRMVGFDEIPAIGLPRDTVVAKPVFDGVAQSKRRVRRALAAHGLKEAVTWSFIGEDTAAIFGEVNDGMRLENPMSSELDCMRPSLLPNLMLAAQRNRDRGFANAALFEVGTVFHGIDPKDQPQSAASVRQGMTNAKDWRETARAVDVFDAKADAIAALQAAGAPVANLQVRTPASDVFHPGRSGALALGKAVLAEFGEMHPKVLKSLDVKGPMVGMQLFLGAIPPARSKGTTRPALKSSNLMPLERDFAFVVNQSVTAESILKAARGADKKLISDVSVFDVFVPTAKQAGGLAEDEKSVAISITLQPTAAALTDKDIESVSEKVIENVIKTTGGSLRG